MTSRFSLPLMVILAALLASSCRADILLFDATTGQPTFQQLPDSPGGQLQDTISLFPSSGPCTSPGSDAPGCAFFVYAADGLTPAHVASGYAPSVDNESVIRETVIYRSMDDFSYYVNFNTEVNIDCNRGVLCKSEVFERPGIPETLLTLPWLNSSGDIIRSDTVVVIPRVMPEPRFLSVSLGMAILGLILFRKTKSVRALKAG